MKRTDITDKKVLARLKKATGQLEALTRMIEHGDDCGRVMVQFQAAEAAVERAFTLFLGQNLKKCVEKKEDAMLEKVIYQLVKR